MSRQLIQLSIVCFAALASHPALATKLSASAFVNADFTDNVGQSTTNTVNEATQTIGFLFGIREDRKRVQADASLKLQKEQFYNDSFSNKTSLTTGFGLLNIGVVESLINWQSSFTRTETLNDPLANDTPDNRGFRTVLRTGPSINYKLSSASSARLSANFITTNNSNDGPADTERVDGSIGYNYSFNSATSMSVSGQYEELLDSDNGAEGFSDFTVSMSFQRLVSKGSFNFSAGFTRLSPDVSEPETVNFFDISFSRQDVLGHDINLSYFEDITDTSIGFSIDQTSPTGTVVVQSISVNDFVQRRIFTASFSRGWSSFGYSASAFWENEYYRVQLSDERARGFNLGLNQQFSRALNLGLNYSFELRDFVQQPSIDKDKITQTSINAGYTLSKQVSLSSYVQFEIRQNNKLSSREYEEWSTGLGINWTFW